jgi:hypothetical protein
MLKVLFLFLTDCELIEIYISHYDCKSADSRGCGLPLRTINAGADTASSVGSIAECGVRNVEEAPSPVGEYSDFPSFPCSSLVG